MCGIAGYFGAEPPTGERIQSALARMKQRGPDVQSFRSHRAGDCKQAVLLHSRLSILDLDARSNQPFESDGCSLVFNGEIYNYLELRSDLEARGVQFVTSSDTEVLLKSYLEFGEECISRFEGMWAFAIWDSRARKLFLSRDRFGEKPLYYWRRPEGFYFASETAILEKLVGGRPSVNRRQLVRYLVQGYKALYKHGETFFEDIRELPSGHCARLGVNGELRTFRYWTPRLVVDHDMTLDEAVEGARERLWESVRIRLRADVPLAFCLSGGVDSAALVSIAAKVHGCRVSTFSIIDSDPRYNELDNIQATVEDTGVDAHFLEIQKSGAMDRLAALVKYHDAPLATITYFVHSMISQRVSSDGFRVVFSGTSADELFTGYYDHFLLHLHELEGTPYYNDALRSWQEHTLGFVRNPILQNPRLFTEHPEFRSHIYDNSDEFIGFLKGELPEPFAEKNAVQSLLKNRTFNELFHEITPVILHEDDLNSMCFSLENRSPYLDSKLFEFSFSIPPQHLIRDGHAKFVLREAVKGVLNDQVRLDRRKKGFNASINSVFDLRSQELRDFLLDPQSGLAEIIDLPKVAHLLDIDPAPNHYSKFLFNMINVRLFLEGRS